MEMKRFHRLFVLLSFIVLLLAACGPAQVELKMAPLAEMPESVKLSSVTVQDAYRFAVANPDVTTELPCYCGCGDMGHTSNYMCYVQATGADGKPIFDEHALGCSICVDITVDAMRLLKEGKSVAEIKTYVDQTYARFGPSNMP
jgi:hypothetical protein